jgi:hypothetical protein
LDFQNTGDRRLTMARKSKSVDKAQAFYDVLAAASGRDFEEYDRPRPWPVKTIPGELAFFLDDLIEHAKALKSQKPAEAVAEVIDLGIMAWYGKLPGTKRRRLGLPDPAGDDRAAALAAEIEALHKREARTKESFEAERSSLLKQIDILFARTLELSADNNELAASCGSRPPGSVPDLAGDSAPTDTPADESQPCFPEPQDSTSGYIALTAHALTVVAPAAKSPPMAPRPHREDDRKKQR